MSAQSQKNNQKNVDDLLFDPQNPRLPPSVNSENDSEVITWLLREASIMELMGAIGQNGYFAGEPVLVVPSEKHAGKFEVVEGNRRLCAVKLLVNPSLAPIRQGPVQDIAKEAKYHPTHLPVVIYNNRDEILAYLGYRHITGIKEWGPLAKAKYLWQLRESYKNQLSPEEQRDSDSTSKQFTLLAKTIGSKSNYVARLLTGYKLLITIKEADFYDIKALNEESINFSILTTALSYAKILEFLGLKSVSDVEAEELNSDNLKEMTSWLFEPLPQGNTRLGDSRNLSRLASIVSNQIALQAFRNGASISDAYKFTEQPGEIFREAIRTALREVKVGQDYVYKVTDLVDSDASIISEVFNIARIVHTVIGEILKDQKKD